MEAGLDGIGVEAGEAVGIQEVLHVVEVDVLSVAVQPVGTLGPVGQDVEVAGPGYVPVEGAEAVLQNREAVPEPLRVQVGGAPGEGAQLLLVDRVGAVPSIQV
jgi:hypothetical protein